ncbi:MAG: DEAD/DEAH box helicase [Lacipirellulaceae bacterium]
MTPPLEAADAPPDARLPVVGPRVAWSVDLRAMEVEVKVGALRHNLQVDAGALRGALKVDVGFTAPEVASFLLGKSSAPATFGCLLPEGRARADGGVLPPATSRKPGPRREPSIGRTRVRPPGDVVKLEDRLRYLLEPPLEALVEAESLRFPFRPFPYQMDGVAFLFPRRHAVIADEMGLGKTMQAITTIRLLAHSGQLRRALLVCPKPLMPNWRRELAEWAPELSVASIEGSPECRQWAWRESGAVVTLAGYETVVRDRELLHAEDTHFDLVVLDESQRIKNTQSATSSAVCGVRRERSWALTGTPIENSTDDLVGIFEFVSPGLLRTGMPAREMGAAVRDLVLRRTKERVLGDLPPKVVCDATIDLTPEQWETYKRAEDEGVIRLRGFERELTIRHVFELVLRLKQVCNFDPSTGASSKAERLEADLGECFASGRKAIVFSQWVDTLGELGKRLERFGPEMYHGRITPARREAALARFRDDPNCGVLLMSYGAGSVGLNLQFASYVFLFDRWWNPAVEDQAINRAHRIGAAGPVTVTRFVSAGTIEERIDEILRGKRELFDKVFEGGSGALPRSAGLTREDLFSLFRLHDAQGRLGADGPLAA